MARVLIVDDEENIRSSLKAALNRRGHEVTTAATYAQGSQFATAPFDVMFFDVMLPDGNGVDLLKEIRNRDPRQLVIMISGHADIDTAVDAIRAGAYDFIEKPLSLDRVLITIDNATRTHHLISEKHRLSSLLYGDFIGESKPIRTIKASIARSSPRATRFLILGESGTGKELVAHSIHSHSRFADGPFIAVNCAALPSELVESELFGHTAGAFTGASKRRTGRFVEADGGSIFLDEISEMPIEAQATILRVIETRQITAVGSDKSIAVDCNIIAASNKNLQAMVGEGRFRQDLLYRLNVVEFNIPALREHPEDIPLLAAYFLARFANETGTSARSLTGEAENYLATCTFPGNIRELKNLMERVNIYCDQPHIDVADLRPLMPQSARLERSTLKEAVSRFEIEYIEASIARNNGNIAETARQLGLERSHLYKKLRKHDND